MHVHVHCTCTMYIHVYTHVPSVKLKTFADRLNTRVNSCSFHLPSPCEVYIHVYKCTLYMLYTTYLHVHVHVYSYTCIFMYMYKMYMYMLTYNKHVQNVHAHVHNLHAHVKMYMLMYNKQVYNEHLYTQYHISLTVPNFILRELLFFQLSVISGLVPFPHSPVMSTSVLLGRWRVL